MGESRVNSAGVSKGVEHRPKRRTRKETVKFGEDSQNKGHKSNPLLSKELFDRKNITLLGSLAALLDHWVQATLCLFYSVTISVLNWGGWGGASVEMGTSSYSLEELDSTSI